MFDLDNITAVLFRRGF